MKTKTITLISFVFALAVSNLLLAQEVSRWEKDIAAFEAKDKEKPPPQGGILFVGSSSIRMWKLGDSFPNLPVINRGFGGSQLADSVQFAERIVLPYKPRVVVLYAGDNDIASKKTPEQVAADFQVFVKKIHAALPETRIVFLPIKPSLKRWALVEKMKQANELIRASIESDKRLAYADIFTPMLGADGQPRAELFKPDGLHLNAEGYKLWTSILLPHLK